MKKQGALPLIVTIGILILLGLSVIVVASTLSKNNSSDTSKIVCRVNLDADLFSNVDIETATCENKGTKCSFFSSETLGIFSREGNVFLIGSDGKRYDKASYDIGLLPLPKEQDVVLDGCLPTSALDKITIKAISKDNAIQDTKIVEVK